jgi:putative transcriptional regulator
MATISNMNKSEYFAGQLLVATPLLSDSCFERSVIYICMHDESGAMGVIVNHLLGNLKCSDLVGQVDLMPSAIQVNAPIYFGGPVESSRGFILHTNDYYCNETTQLSNDISITSNIDTLKQITSGTGPKKSIIALGHAGWAAGQLEKEVMLNSWINVPASENLIFNMDNKKKWNESAMSLGVNLNQYSTIAGHA